MLGSFKAMAIAIASASTLAATAQQGSATNPYSLNPTPSTVVWGYYWSEAAPVLHVHSGDYVNVRTVLTSSPDRLEAAGVSADQVEKELLAEAELLRKEGLTAEELKRAKAKIVGQKKIARADLGNLATTTALDELYGLGWQRTELDDVQYEAVTLEQVKAIAQKYLKADAYVISIMKPEAK